MDKVIPALIVAAISSITFIAYKHPKAYKTIFLPLAIGYLIIMLAMTCWNLGGEFTYRALIADIEANKLKEAADVATSYQIPIWIILSVIGGYFYLFALTFLPSLLEKDKPEDK